MTTLYPYCETCDQFVTSTRRNQLGSYDICKPCDGAGEVSRVSFIENPEETNVR